MLILDQSVYTIKGLTQQHLWIIIMSIARRAGQGQQSFPSYQTIAEDCQISRSTAIRHINEMFDLGIVTKTKRINHRGDQTSNLYGFHDAFKSLGSLKFEGNEKEEGSSTSDTTPVAPVTLPSSTSDTLTASQGNCKLSLSTEPDQNFQKTVSENQNQDTWKSEITDHPLFAKAQSLEFSNLDAGEVDYTLELYQASLTNGRRPHFTQAVSWLKNRSLDKKRAEKITTSPPPKQWQNSKTQAQDYSYRHPPDYYKQDIEYV